MIMAKIRILKIPMKETMSRGGVQQAKNGFLFVLPPHKVVVTYKKQDFVFYLGFLAWFNPPHRQFRFGLFSI